MKRFCKNLIVFTHTKISSVTLGGLLLIWSMLALGPADSLFVQYLNLHSVSEEWATIMASDGLLLLAGSLFPWRSGRHIGLALACFVLFALGGYFFIEGLYTPVTVSMPWLGLMALITLMSEVRGKPRVGRT